MKTVSFFLLELVLLRMKQVDESECGEDETTFIYSALLGLSECKLGKSNTFNYASSK